MPQYLEARDNARFTEKRTDIAGEEASSSLGVMSEKSDARRKGVVQMDGEMRCEGIEAGRKKAEEVRSH